MAAVRTACSITTKVFKTLTTAESVTKKDKSPVTIGDFSAQATINYILNKKRPRPIFRERPGRRTETKCVR